MSDVQSAGDVHTVKSPDSQDPDSQDPKAHIYGSSNIVNANTRRRNVRLTRPSAKCVDFLPSGFAKDQYCMSRPEWTSGEVYLNINIRVRVFTYFLQL